MRNYLIAFLVLAMSIQAPAQEKKAPAIARPVCGPYLQNVTDSSFTVIWTTDIDAVSWVEIAPADDTNWNNTERPRYYDLRGFGRRPITKVHHVTVDGLHPGTRYRYRILMQGVTDQYNRNGVLFTPAYGLDVNSHPTAVSTKKKEYSKLHIATVNDMHESDSLFRVLFADAKAEKYDFVVFNGDMTSEIADGQDIVKNYMKSASELFASDVPVYVTRGNHEYRGNAALKWMDYWDTPTGKTYQAVSYGKFFFIFLDSGEDKNDQDIRNFGLMVTDRYTTEEAKWLQTVVDSKAFKDAEVRIVYCHMQPDPKGWYGNATVAGKFVPVLNKAGIDVMLCGHIHNYKYYKVGETTAEFPVVCNRNRELMTVDVDRDNIHLRFYDSTRKQVNSLDFKTKQYSKK